MHRGGNCYQNGCVHTGGTSHKCCTVLHDWTDYIARASDNPSVWVLLDSIATCVVVCGKPKTLARPGDTVAPIGVPTDTDDGNPLPGYTVVNVGLPTFSVIEQVYSAAPVDGSARDLTADAADRSRHRVERLLHQARLDHVAHHQHRRPCDDGARAVSAVRAPVVHAIRGSGQGRSRDELLHGQPRGRRRVVGYAYHPI